ANRYTDHSTSEKPFRPGLAGLNASVGLAEQEDTRVRAIGGGWSMNNVAFTDEYLVDSGALDYSKIGIDDGSFVTPAFGPKKQQLVFVQCGVQVKALNDLLEKAKLALPTSGASNGQTMVGAISTGTHGSAHSLGAMPEYVRGIHLVTKGDKHVFIQRQSDPAITDAFCHWLDDAELIEDDELFNAAVVGFGSFGLIHGLLLEVEPLYLLERFVKNCDYAVVKEAIQTLDMTGLGLPKGDDLPFHFEVVVNPYRLEEGRNGAFIRVYYKNTDISTLPEKNSAGGGFETTPDLVDAMAKLADMEPGLISLALQHALLQAVKPTDGKLISGTPGEQFGDSEKTNGGTSFEVGVALADIGRASDIILDVSARYVFPAPLAFRFVKGSRATLSFTHFSGIAVALEMPGIDSQRAKNAHQEIFKALSDSNIP
ncbi:MAG: FAD-binding protein, partial [Psychrosphaera sp.]|nr:FAD-binding protein [Psychrosphaera sp.]